MLKHRTPKAILALALSAALFVNACSSTWIQIALRDLPVLVQIATSIAGIIAAAEGRGQLDPRTSSQIKQTAAQVQTDLSLLKSLVDSYNVAAASAKPAIQTQIDAALTAVQENLSSILSAAHINNAALQATIAASVGLAISTVLAIQSLLPAPATANAARAKLSVNPGRPMNPKQLKTAFNDIVTSGGYAEFAIH
jgi:hypothetical protein